MKRTIALLCALALVVFTLTACGSGYSSPQKTAQTFFAAVQSLDLDAINDCGENGALVEWDLIQQTESGDEAQLLAFLRELAAKISYRITDMTVDGDTAAVQAAVDYADASMLVKSTMTDVMADMLMALLSDDGEADAHTRFFAKLRENLKAETPGTQTVDVTLSMVKTDDGWRIRELPDAMLTVLTGNTTEMLQEAAQTFSGVASAQVEA